MNLIPKDIKKRDFKKSLRGYDVDEVDAFLETVSSQYEKLLVDSKNLTEKVKSLLADVEIYKENESNLQKAIIQAQGIAEEVIQNAKKRSEIIIKEAELDARKVRQDIEDEILSKKQELEEIKLRNDKIIEDLRVYLNDKINELDEFVKSKKIFKMELSKIEHPEAELDQEHEQESKPGVKEDSKNIKKVYINNNDSYEDQKKSFDDTFEVK
ncbi:MAG: DivIVA domain-containing protein [Ignavibacteria bacterium]|nr:DivIVA domain-containing protein [Ignavibacteria bacterium]